MPPGRIVFQGAPTPTSSDAGSLSVVALNVTPPVPRSGARTASGWVSADGCVTVRSSCPTTSDQGLRRQDNRSGSVARGADGSGDDASTSKAEPFHAVPLASASSIRLPVAFFSAEAAH